MMSGKPGPDGTTVEQEAVAQFTVHADAFARAAVVNDERALTIIDGLASVTPADRVLDVACGPGIVTCRLADHGGPVVGLDLTPAMLTLARHRTAAAGRAATTAFARARMAQLPHPDGSFEVVVNRYALHHAADPDRVADELVRVTAPGGRLVIVDFAATDDPVAATAYDDAERLRDPSHVRNLTADEQRRLFVDRGCSIDEMVTYRVDARLSTVLANSHGPDHDGVRRAFAASTTTHGLGVEARREDGDITFSYPLVAHRFRR